MKPGEYRSSRVVIFFTLLAALTFYVAKDSSSFKDLPDWLILVVIVVLALMLLALPLEIVEFVIGLIYSTKLEHQKALMDYKAKIENKKAEDAKSDN